MNNMEKTFLIKYMGNVLSETNRYFIKGKMLSKKRFMDIQENKWKELCKEEM